jgi:hypothetical protein
MKREKYRKKEEMLQNEKKEKKKEPYPVSMLAQTIPLHNATQRLKEKGK